MGTGQPFLELCGQPGQVSTALIAMRDTVQGFVFNPMLEQIFNIADMHK